MKRLPILIVLPLFLSACLPPAFTYVSLAFDGFALAVTGKTVADHALSAVAGSDCIMVRALMNKPICVEPHSTMVADASPSAPTVNEVARRVRISFPKNWPPGAKLEVARAESFPVVGPVEIAEAGVIALPLPWAPTSEPSARQPSPEVERVIAEAVTKTGPEVMNVRASGSICYDGVLMNGDCMPARYLFTAPALTLAH
jgi:hypothetical protein